MTHQEGIDGRHSVYRTATMISHIVNSHRYKVTNVNHGSDQLDALSNDSKHCKQQQCWPVKFSSYILHYHLCWITFHCAPAENDCFPTFGSMQHAHIQGTQTLQSCPETFQNAV